MAQQLVTYGDLIASILEKLGIQASDTLATSKIKRALNEVYLDEVVPFKRWTWLQKAIQVVHKAAFITGTVNVDQLSAIVTLNTAPTGAGSFTGYQFSVADSDQVYVVLGHTADSTTITLTTPFQEDSDATATFKLWRDSFDLPINAKEVVEIWHKEQNKPLNPLGPQGIRQLQAQDPKPEGAPTDFNTWDFFDPSVTHDGDDDQETESDRYRQTRIYPAINNKNMILNVDYIQEVTALEDSTDEPLMPIGDRIVLFYGGLAMGYSAIARDEDMHDRYWMKFQQKLSRMAGDRDSGQDTPKLRPNPRYINSIRNSGLRKRGF